MSAYDKLIQERFSEVELYREQMHDYQDTGLQFLKKNPYSGLFIDMGLGKTVTAGTLIADLLNGLIEDEELEDGEKILVVGPLKVATRTWPDEFRKWEHLAGFNLSVIHVDDDDPELKAAAARARLESREQREGPTQREKAAREAVAARKEGLRQEKATDSARIHMISRDWIEWLVMFYNRNRKNLKWPYRVIIIDESSGFKDHNSNRFKMLQSVRDQPGFVKRLHILTATPAAETYEHLFAQIYLLDGGTAFTKEITNFRRRYFTENRWTRKWELRPDGERDILAKIAHLVLVMKEEDYLPRVPPVFVQRQVEMTEDEMRLYLTMEKDSLVELPDGTEVVAETAAALSAKLLQMSSGVLYDTKMQPGLQEEDDHVKVLKVHKIHDHKIEELRQLVEEAQGKPILVGYHHRSSKDRILRAFPQAVPMDKAGKCIKKWNQGKIPILLMHPASGGHGLNLQKGGHIIVFFDIPWSLELYLQFIGRLARQGQLHRVTVFFIVCKGTLDATVIKALTAKEDAQNMLFGILKKMRRKLTKLLQRNKNAIKEDWDNVVEVLTDYEHDEL